MIRTKELLAAIGHGDREGLRVLYERHAPWLMLRLRRRGADDPPRKKSSKTRSSPSGASRRHTPARARWQLGSGA